MKKYIEPEIGIKVFNSESIVTVSGLKEGGVLGDIAGGQSGTVTQAVTYDEIFTVTE